MKRRQRAAHEASRNTPNRERKPPMMIVTGPLRLGAAQVYSRDTGELIGYAFAEAHGGGQLQRWVLYRSPQNSFDIRRPPANMESWTVSDWQANVAGLWRPGS